MNAASGARTVPRPQRADGHAPPVYLQAVERFKKKFGVRTMTAANAVIGGKIAQQFAYLDNTGRVKAV